MFGYGIILPFDKAIGYYAENLGTDVKNFVINTIYQEYEENNENTFDKDNIKESINNPIEFWFNNGFNYNFIDDGYINIGKVRNLNDRKTLYIFIGRCAKFLNNRALSFERINKILNIENIERRLLSYGFDINECDYYFTTGNKFILNIKNKSRKL